VDLLDVCGLILVLSTSKNAVPEVFVRKCEALGELVRVVESEDDALSVVQDPELLISPLVYAYQSTAFIKRFRLMHPKTRLVALTSSPYIETDQLSDYGIDFVFSYGKDPIDRVSELLSTGPAGTD
jgi:hypothetical protein